MTVLTQHPLIVCDFETCGVSADAEEAFPEFWFPFGNGGTGSFEREELGMAESPYVSTSGWMHRQDDNEDFCPSHADAPSTAPFGWCLACDMEHAATRDDGYCDTCREEALEMQEEE